MSEPTADQQPLPPPGNSSVRGGPPATLVVAAATLLLGAMWVVLLWRYRYWIATDDHAVLQLALEQMRDGEIPLVGPYSRLDFRHPGPVREWLFFLPYMASGGRAAALPATTIVFHTVMFALAIRAGHRWAGTRGAITAAVSAAIMYLAFGKQLHIPWNPLLAATALFAATWGLLAFIRTGRWAQVVLCASAAAQMHASAAPVAATVVLVVVGLAVARRARRWSFDDRPIEPHWRGRVAAAVFVFMWSGPIVDTFTSERSNLAALVDASTTDDQVGLADAVALAGRIVHPVEMIRGTYLRPSADTVTGTGGAIPFVVWAVLGILAIVLAARSARASDRLSIVVMSALSVVSVLSIGRFLPPLLGYLFASVTAVAAVVVTVVVSTIVGSLATAGSAARVIRVDRRVPVVVAAAVLLCGTALGVSELNRVVAERRSTGINAAVDAQVVDGELYAVRAGGTIGALVEAEVALQIELSGGEASSNIFALDLPPEPRDAPLFVAAMTGVRQCLLDVEIGTVVVDDGIEAVGADVAVFLIQPNERRALLRCPPF